MTGTPPDTNGWNDSMPISLLEKLRADLKHAMKSGNTAVRDAIRQVMGEYPRLTVPLTLESGKKSFRVKRPEEISDQDLLDLIKGLVKSEKIVLEVKKEATSPYLEILQRYLPLPATREEIATWIGGHVDLAGLKSPQQAMGPIMKHFGKRADGNIVREVLQTLCARH
jgi:uncharacterized protein YqeY